MLHSSQLARLFEVSNNCWEAAGENNDKTGSRASCAKSDDRAAFESVVTALPLVTYQAGETVIADGWLEDRSAADPQERQCCDSKRGRTDCQGD